jgi:hypothetical protein
MFGFGRHPGKVKCLEIKVNVNPSNAGGLARAHASGCVKKMGICKKPLFYAI